jgi:hypothetical protein
MKLTPPFTADDILDGVALMVKEENERKVRTVPRASSLANCARQQVYYMQDEDPAPLDDYGRTIRYTAEQGNRSEDLTIEALGEVGTIIGMRQVELPEDFWVTGHPDGGEIFYEGAFNEDPTTDFIKTGGDLNWGFEHKHFGAWKFKNIFKDSRGPNGLMGSSDGVEILTQCLSYGIALEWDAVAVTIVAQDASAVRSDWLRCKKYATEGKTQKTRDNNAWALDPTFNPKIQVHGVDLRPLKQMYAGNLESRALDLSAAAKFGTASEVRREHDPAANVFPCTFCDHRKRCEDDGSGDLVITANMMRVVNG